MGDESWSWEDNMKVVLIEMIQNAEEICMIPGWENSVGASFEKLLAEKLKIPIKMLFEYEKC
jgi:hypothetical protein